MTVYNNTLKCFAIVLLTGLTGGCMTSGHVRNDYCSLTSFIYVSAADILTDMTARDILTHNETRQRICD